MESSTLKIMHRTEKNFRDNLAVQNDQVITVSKFRTSASQYIATLAASIIMFIVGSFDGFTTILLAELEKTENSISRSELEETEISITKSELTWFSSQLFMQPVGAILVGLVAQQTGSRLILLLSSIMFSTSWIIFYYAKNSAMVLIAQGIASICLVDGACISYVAEISQPHLRSVLMATTNFSRILGSLFTVTIATFLYWRAITLVNLVFALSGLTVMIFIPNSPYSLAYRGKFLEAEKSLAWLRGWTSIVNVRSEFQIMKEAVLSKSIAAEDKSSKNRIQDKIKPYFQRSFCLPLASVSYVSIIRAFMGSDAIQKFGEVIFKQFHIPFAKYLTVALFAMEIIGSLIYIPIVKFIGKRRLMFTSLVAAGLTYLTISISMNLINGGILTEDIYNWIPTLGILMSILITTTGIDSIGFMFTGELFPNKFRDVGAGMGMFVNASSSAIMNKVFIYMAEWMTMSGLFVFFSVVSLIGLVTFYFILPETEGKSLMEIEEHYTNFKIKKSARNNYNRRKTRV